MPSRITNSDNITDIFCLDSKEEAPPSPTMSCSDLQVQMMNSFLVDDASRISQAKETILKQLAHILFDQQHLIENCLDLLDDETKQVKRVKSATTTRVFWKVPSQSFRGANQKDYTCTEKFCPCKSFRDLSKSSNGEVLCKHLLVIRIGSALNLIVEQIVTDTMFADMMCD